MQDYGLGDAPCEFVLHSENVTFRVITPEGASRVLRVHAPVAPQYGHHGADLDMVRSEILWLEALHRKADVPAPIPVRNLDDQRVTTIEMGGTRYNCTMLEWLPGEIYDSEFETEETVAQIGTIVGKLHFHASRWRRPQSFLRPERDVAHFRRTLEILRPAVNDGRIAYMDFKRFGQVLDFLEELVQAQHNTRQNYGLLHGDLHRGNFLYHEGRISLIDFSMCAFGHFAYDLGVCISSIQPEFHLTFLNNYRHFFRLTPDAERLIEGYFVASMIDTFSFWMDNPDAQEILVNRVPRITIQFATPFTLDERFWFTQPEF